MPGPLQCLIQAALSGFTTLHNNFYIDTYFCSHTHKCIHFTLHCIVQLGIWVVIFLPVWVFKIAQTKNKKEELLILPLKKYSVNSFSCILFVCLFTFWRSISQQCICYTSFSNLVGGTSTQPASVLLVMAAKHSVHWDLEKSLCMQSVRFAQAESVGQGKMIHLPLEWKHIAASGLCCRMALVDSRWAISYPIPTQPFHHQTIIIDIMEHQATVTKLPDAKRL